MHVNLVITKLDAGGMERVCITLCNQFFKDNRSFTLYALYPAGRSKILLEGGVDYQEILRPARYAMGAFLRIAKRDEQAPFLTFGVETFVVLCLLKWIRLIRNPVFYRESTSVEHHYPKKWIWLMRKCVPLGKGIVLQSEDSNRAYQRLGLRAKQIAIIQNPCYYAESATVEPFRLPDRNGPVQLLSVGRFARIKGHMRLIEAFEGIQKVRPGSTLTLVGEGKELSALQEKVRTLKLDEAIHFAGYASDIRPFFKAATIFVLPSFYEGLSNALIEALVCRCPVLAFGEGGSSEFMNKLGLGDFWLEGNAFDQSLLDGIDKVCNSEAELWEFAWHSLVAQVSPKRVADQIWGFLGGT